MVNEIEEFRAYTEFPVYKADSKKDVSYMGRFTLPMLLDLSGFRHILTIGLDGALEIFRPLLGIGVAVPSYGGNECLDLKEVGISQQPHHRLIIVWLDICGCNVSTHHKTGFLPCFFLRLQR